MEFFKKKKSQPLPPVQRRAGQSLHEQWTTLLDDQLAWVVFGPAMIWAMCAVVWIQSWSKAPASPRFWLSVAIAATGIAAIAYRRLLPKARNLLRGEHGERVVAEELEELRAYGYRSFHDIQAGGYNIDHVVVGPTGVFAIETKFRSGSGQIEFRNGEGLFIGGYRDEKDCLSQARGNAGEVSRIIQENCNMYQWVKPLVVFVGDWKVKDAWRETDARVVTASGLKRYFLKQDQPSLMKGEIDLICSHLKRTVRS